MTLSLHFPQPDDRQPDPTACPPAFDAAGAVPRPVLDVAAAEIRDLAFRLIRVLDDDGHACGDWQPDLSDDVLLTGLRDMLTLRAYDKRMLIAQRQGKTSFYMQHLGEEAISTAFQTALAPGDMNFPTYRQAGLLIAAKAPLATMMCQVFSNSGDPAKGRQLPVFYSDRPHGFFSISGNLATQTIQAVGWAMASALRGQSDIAAAWIGDGATAESDFHAALVFASTYRVPVVLNIVNNQWAISTFQGIGLGGAGSYAARGHGFGIPSLRVDGNDWLAVRAVADWAAARARANLGPTLIEYVTYRASGHSSSDDPAAYRPRKAHLDWPLGDPVDRLKNHLIRRGIWDDATHARAEAEVMAEVTAAQREAEALGTLLGGPALPAHAMFADVYAEMPPHLRAQCQEAASTWHA